MHPDDFIIALMADSAAGIATVVLRQAAALKHPPRSRGELLDTLRAIGLTRSVDVLRTWISSG